MKISILTTISNPVDRQDKFIEAIACYLDFADEVIVVDGSSESGEVLSLDYLAWHEIQKNEKLKIIKLLWPKEWNWVQLPKSLNAGRKECTSDWILKIDIDQFFHEKDFTMVRQKLAECPRDCQVATFQKMSMTYGGRYYQKGGQPIAFRNNPDIVIGKNLDKETDLCFAIKKTGVERLGGQGMLTNGFYGHGNYTEEYDLPVGGDLKSFKTGVQYWNYDYFFKTKEFTKKEFWRFSRAYNRYFKTWKFGDSEDASFNVFLNMMDSRHKGAPYTYKLEDHPKYIREAVKNLAPEMFGFNGWREE